MQNDQTVDPFPTKQLQRWRASASDTTLRELVGHARSLGVVVPHADDETLGCGGLIALAAAAGITVTITILTDGAASHPGSTAWPPARLARRRRSEARAAVRQLAGSEAKTLFVGASDGALDDKAGHCAAIPPADLYVTCWRDDPHPDHRAAFFIAFAAAQSQGAPLLAFPLWVLTTLEPVPQIPLFRLNVRAKLKQKRLAIAMHQSQLGNLIKDTNGFILGDELQRLFVRGDELYLRVISASSD